MLQIKFTIRHFDKKNKMKRTPATTFQSKALIKAFIEIQRRMCNLISIFETMSKDVPVLFFQFKS